MDSISKTTCSVRTSATVRGSVIFGSGRTTAPPYGPPAAWCGPSRRHQRVTVRSDRSPHRPLDPHHTLVGLGRSPAGACPLDLGAAGGQSVVHGDAAGVER